MKGKHRETGGKNEAAEDLKTKPAARDNASKIESEASEKCAGGRAGRKRGGHVHHENMDSLKHAKHVGPIRGASKGNAGRKPRKSGGRTGADSSPFSSARHGSSAPGHKVEMGMD